MNNRCWYLLSKRLSGNATDAELSELDDYLQEHTEWQYSVEQVGRIWDANENDDAREVDFNSHLVRMERSGIDTEIFAENIPLVVLPPRKPKRKWLLPILVAASLIVVVGIWFLQRPASQPEISQNPGTVNKKVVETNKGDRRKMILPDGSQVWLNAESKLEYSPAFGKTDRAVRLSGEAYFDVVKNVELPFTIETNKIHIKVTGTVFNVKAYPGERVSETSLIRGRVEVTVTARPDEKYVLNQNEKLIIRDEAPLKNTTLHADKKAVNEPLVQVGYVNYIGNDSAAVETSWVYDRLVFDDESLKDIAIKMERWYGVKIDIKDQQLADQRLTYTIKKETVSQALRNMQYAMRFHYSINQNIVTITR